MEMDSVKAVQLLHELVEAEVEMVKAVNNGRKVPKKLEHRERCAVRNLFVALTDHEPTPEEITKVCEL